MPWVKLDTSFPEHPKVIALPATAFRLYIVGLCYAARNDTDGYIPDEIVPKHERRTARTLEDRKLWERHPNGGWQIHDYLDWQESHAERNARSNAARNAARTRWSHAERNAEEKRREEKRPAPSPPRARADDEAITLHASEAREALARAKREEQNNP
jgi:hypothetical protein